jgi:adenosine deaminase
LCGENFAAKQQRLKLLLVLFRWATVRNYPLQLTITALTVVCYSVLFCHAVADTSRDMVWSMNESGENRIVFHFDSSGAVSVTIFPSAEGTGTFASWPPVLLSNLEILVNGIPTGVQLSPTSGVRFGPRGRGRRATRVEARLFGRTMAVFSYDRRLGEVRSEISPRHISVFDMRQFSVRGIAHRSEWLAGMTSIAHGEQRVSLVDLHTHFSGAVRAETMLQVAMEHRTIYPVRLLNELGINIPERLTRRIQVVRGEPCIPLGDGFPNSSQLETFSSALRVSANETITFASMERIYRFRSPLAKNLQAFPDYLRSLAEDYKAMGIRYAELSLFDIMNSEWRDSAREVVADIERDTGVRLRFLASYWRHETPERGAKVVTDILAVATDPLIVGIDFMGEETNPTRDFEDAIRRFAHFRRSTRPNFQIRVHAGENPTHPENVREAIELGATRIGHGVYGVTPDVLALARRHGTIVEFNVDSNLALRNIAGRTSLPIREYLDAGVRVTLGTDGHGIYAATSHSGPSVLRGTSLSPGSFGAIYESDRQYLGQVVGIDVPNDCHSPRLKSVVGSLSR